MGLIAHLAADAASFSVRDADGSSASFETPWHRAVLVLQNEAGAVLRSVEAFADGRVDVRGDAEDAHEVSRPEEATSAGEDDQEGKAILPSSDDHVAAPEERGSDNVLDGGTDASGFAAFSAHVDEAHDDEVKA